MATIKKDVTKGSKFTAPGTLPASQLKRFGLRSNIGSSEGTGEGLYGSAHQRRFIKRNTQRWATMRLLAGSQSTRLPSPLKSAVRYFAIPMGRDNVSNYATPAPAAVAAPAYPVQG
jgi:hypothetical protein